MVGGGDRGFCGLVGGPLMHLKVCCLDLLPWYVNGHV